MSSLMIELRIEIPFSSFIFLQRSCSHPSVLSFNEACRGFTFLSSLSFFFFFFFNKHTSAHCRLVSCPYILFLLLQCSGSLTFSGFYTYVWCTCTCIFTSVSVGAREADEGIIFEGSSTLFNETGPLNQTQSLSMWLV